MRPFKLFFGIAVGVILFLFVARVAIMAFIIAGIMSIVYAIYRRLKDFITYDRYGEYYIPEYRTARPQYRLEHGVEPLFQETFTRPRRTVNNVRFIDPI